MRSCSRRRAAACWSGIGTATRGTSQTFYAGLKRERELEHDLQVYRAYERERSACTERGARIERVALDYELKRDYQKWLHERDGTATTTTATPIARPMRSVSGRSNTTCPTSMRRSISRTSALSTRSRMAVGTTRTSRSSRRTTAAPTAPASPGRASPAIGA